MTGAVLTTGAGGGGGDVNAAPLPASGGNRFASWRMRSNALRRFSGCTIGAEVVREVFSVAGEAYRQQFRDQLHKRQRRRATYLQQPHAFDR